MVNVKRCKKHPKYKALRKPMDKCVACCEMYLVRCKREHVRRYKAFERSTVRVRDAYERVARVKVFVRKTVVKRDAFETVFGNVDFRRIGESLGVD